MRNFYSHIYTIFNLNHSHNYIHTASIHTMTDFSMYYTVLCILGIRISDSSMYYSVLCILGIRIYTLALKPGLVEPG